MARLFRCANCGKFRKIQRHHILPIRHFGDNRITIPLCAPCHSDAEEKIHEAENGQQLQQEDYILLALKFISWRQDEKGKRAIPDSRVNRGGQAETAQYHGRFRHL